MLDKILNSKSNILYDDNIGWVPLSTVVEQARKMHADKKVVVSLSPIPIDGFMDWLGALANDIPLHQWMRTGEYDLGEVTSGFTHIAYTSGTTGYPQRIENPLSSFYHAAEDMNNVVWTQDGAMFAGLPASTSSAVSLHWLPALISNRNLVLKKFNPLSWKHDIEEYGVSFAPMAMAMAKMLMLNKDIAKTTKWNTLKSVGIGANIIEPGTFAWWRERGVAPYNMYGSTETPALAITGNDDNWLNIKLPSTEVRIDEEGVLEFRRKGQGDWWHSNDIAQTDPSKGWCIIGRTTTQFKYRDIRVCPEQYEALAKSVPGVVNAGLALIDNKMFLFYEGDNGIENNILDYVGQYVQPGTLPRVKQVAKMPVNHLGKLARKELVTLK